jgi:hypothetical protein
VSATLGWADALWLARHRTPNDRLRFWGSALSSAVAAALFCTAAGLVALGSDTVESAIHVVTEPGTRVGVVIAVLLVALPALHLTGQTWKLGSVERRQRLRQLRDAGAGQRELRRVVFADTVIPVAVGAVLGVLILGVGIALLNLRGAFMPLFGDSAEGIFVPTGEYVLVPELAVFPNVVVASWWPALLAIGGVSALAALAAARSVRRLDRPLRRRPSVLGLVAARAARATRRPALLLALRRLAEEPRATARPALLLGLAALVAGASTWLRRQFRVSLGQQWTQDTFFPQSFALVTLATWIGIGLCALGLVVALADAVLRRRRADAVAVASGVPVSVLRRALVLQAILPAVPIVLAGLCVGGGLSVLFTGRSAESRSAGPVPGDSLIPLPWSGWIAWGLGIIVVAALAAFVASTGLRRTTRTDQLRVPS